MSHLCRVNYMPAVSSVVADAEKMTCECVRVSVRVSVRVCERVQVLRYPDCFR